GRPYRVVAQTEPTPGLDGRGYLCAPARNAHHARAAPSGAPQQGSQPHDPGSHDALGCRGVPQAGHCRIVPPTLARRARPAFAENRSANGRAALPNPSHGAQRDLGPPPGLQSPSQGNGPSRPGTRRSRARAELQGHAANLERLQRRLADVCPERSGTAVSPLTRSGGAPPCRPSSGSGGTARQKTPGQAVSLVEQTTRPSAKSRDTRRLGLKSLPFGSGMFDGLCVQGAEKENGGASFSP